MKAESAESKAESEYCTLTKIFVLYLQAKINVSREYSERSLR